MRFSWLFNLTLSFRSMLSSFDYPVVGFVSESNRWNHGILLNRAQKNQLLSIRIAWKKLRGGMARKIWLTQLSSKFNVIILPSILGFFHVFFGRDKVVCLQRETRVLDFIGIQGCHGVHKLYKCKMETISSQIPKNISAIPNKVLLDSAVTLRLSSN